VPSGRTGRSSGLVRVRARVRVRVWVRVRVRNPNPPLTGPQLDGLGELELDHLVARRRVHLVRLRARATVRLKG